AGSSGAARLKIEAALEDAPHAQAVADVLARTIGITSDSVSRDDSFWAARTFFEHLGRAKPTVLSFDDLHWAESTFADLVEHIAQSRAPLLLACSARPELLEIRPAWSELAPDALLRLSPLDAGATRALALNVLGAGELDASVSEAIAPAGGNPLFVEQMLALWDSEGVLDRTGDRWVLRGGRSEEHTSELQSL